VHLQPTPGHTPGQLSVALEDGDALFLFAGDVSYTEQVMLQGVVDGVTPDPAVARATLGRVQQLVIDPPTVSLPTHDPAAVGRLTQRQVVSASSVPEPV